MLCAASKFTEAMRVAQLRAHAERARRDAASGSSSGSSSDSGSDSDSDGDVPSNLVEVSSVGLHLIQRCCRHVVTRGGWVVLRRWWTKRSGWHTTTRWRT